MYYCSLSVFTVSEESADEIKCIWLKLNGLKTLNVKKYTFKNSKFNHFYIDVFDINWMTHRVCLIFFIDKGKALNGQNTQIKSIADPQNMGHMTKREHMVSQSSCRSVIFNVMSLMSGTQFSCSKRFTRAAKLSEQIVQMNSQKKKKL